MEWRKRRAKEERGMEERRNDGKCIKEEGMGKYEGKSESEGGNRMREIERDGEREVNERIGEERGGKETKEEERDGRRNGKRWMEGKE